MTWQCPYLKNDGSCELRNRDCEPMMKGCVLKSNAKYRRLFTEETKRDDGARPGKKES